MIYIFKYKYMNFNLKVDKRRSSNSVSPLNASGTPTTT